MIVSKSFVKFNKLEDNPELKPVAYIKVKGTNKGILAILPQDHYNGEPIRIDGEDVFGKHTKAKTTNAFQLLPNLRGITGKNIRDIGYIVGKSGSGKTFMVGQFAKEYKAMFPKRKIIYISPQALEEDDILLQVNPLLASTHGEEGITNWVDPETKFTIPEGYGAKNKPVKSDFDKSLIIVDDLESVNDKKIKAGLDNFISSILHTGRHRSITVMFLKHTACDGRTTKSILNETNFITIFRGNSGKKIDYLLTTYVGLNKEQLKYVKNLRDRSITFHTGIPNFILTDKEIKILE